MCPACGDAGDPISPSIGNEHQAETDYRSNSAFALEFTRYYNSNSAVATTTIGAQWRHTFDRSLVSQTTQVFGAGGSEENFTTATLYRPDGKITIFSSTDGVTWTPVADHFGRLNASYNTSHVLTGWTYVTADDHTETYNASGRLLSIRDRAGRTQTPSYNAQGQLFQVLDSYGRKLQLTYDANGRVHTLLDPANGQFVYGYDDAGNLHTVQYPDNTVRTYAYNEQNLTSATNLPHALTGIVDENNSRYASIGYDSSGRAQNSILGGVANSFSIQYPPANSTNAARVTDPLGQARNYSFSATNGVWQVTGFSSTGSEAACGGCALAAFISYDANGFIQQKKDANGIATNYTIDSRGLEESRTEAYNTTVARTTTTTWETAFHLPHEVDEPGRKTVYTHDAATGNLLSATITDTQTGASRTTSYSSYNSLGEPQTIDGPRTDVSDITHYLYDAQGNLSQITDALGHVTKITQYDAHGNPKVMLDQNGVETDYGYDPRQRLTSKTIAGALTQYKFDNAGNFKTLIQPNGTTITYGYDAAHRQTDITDNLGNHIHYTLDGLGNRTREDTYNPGGTLVRTLSRAIDPTTGWVKHLYGANGQDTQYNYDNVGNLETATQNTSAGNFQTINTYDDLYRLSQVQDAALGNTYYGYDPFGNLESVQDSASLITGYTYNGLGDLVQLNSPDTGITTYTPDTAGNVLIKTDARPISANYTYDALNRVKTITYPNAAENVTYYYDGSNYSPAALYGIGRLTGIADQSGTTTYYYNPRGTLSSEVHSVAGVAYTTAYAYDAADTLKAITYPSGDTATYQLNALGQVSEVDAVIGGSAKTLASGIQYLPFGSWTQLTLGNGVITTRAFDTDYRVGSIISGSVLSRSYGYDQRNNIASITDALRPARTQALTYDAIGELTNATGIYGSLGYFYNGSSGDRTRATAVLPANTNYIYPTTSHKLSSTSGLLGPTNYSYDPAGNLTGKGTTTYTFNNAGRLATISGSGSPQYLYNATSQRVEKTVTSGLLGGMHTSTVFSYDQSGLLLQEGTAAGALGSEYFYIGGEPLALYTHPATLLGPGPAQVYYYHNDHLGTPQVLTNSSGTSAWSADYQPFGTVTLGTQTITNNLRLPGQYSDSESGLYQNWYREYDPALGRYVESDPIGLKGGINTYLYAIGNPVRGADTNGLIVWKGTFELLGLGKDPVSGTWGTFNLSSECDEDQRKATVAISAFAFGLGIGDPKVPTPAMGTRGVITFNDSNIRANPTVFDGRFSVRSIGITLGPIDLSATTIYLGDAISTSIDEKGFDVGLSQSIRGQAHITSVKWSKCDCNN